MHVLLLHGGVFCPLEAQGMFWGFVMALPFLRLYWTRLRAKMKL